MKPKQLTFLLLFLFLSTFYFCFPLKKKQHTKTLHEFKWKTRSRLSDFSKFRFSKIRESEESNNEPIFFSKAWSNSTFDLQRDHEKESKVIDVLKFLLSNIYIIYVL